MSSCLASGENTFSLRLGGFFFFGQKMGGFNEIGNTAIIIRDVKQFLKSIFGPIKIFISYNPVLGVPHWIAGNYYYISFMW